eukprot:11198653-Lingulodinium_polyedra.AAC.1
MARPPRLGLRALRGIESPRYATSALAGAPAADRANATLARRTAGRGRGGARNAPYYDRRPLIKR